MGILAGAMSGAGEYVARVSFEEERAKITASRDAILQEFQRGENALTRDHQTGLADKQIGATAEQGKLGREHSTSLATMTDNRVRDEGEATRANQKEIAGSHERAASERHGQSIVMQGRQLEQSMKIAEMSRPLQQDAEGHFFKMGEKGPVYLEVNGQKFKGPKDLTARETKAADAILAQMKATSADTLMDQSAKNAAMNGYQQSLNALLGGVAPKATEPSAAHIDALKAKAKDPRAAAAFDAQYGAGSAARYLKDSPKVEPAPSSPGAKLDFGINPNAPVPRALRALGSAKETVDAEAPEGHIPGLIDYARRALKN